MQVRHDVTEGNIHSFVHSFIFQIEKKLISNLKIIRIMLCGAITPQLD